MKRLAAFTLLVAFGLSMSLSDGEAAWKKRGWYVTKKTGANCVMRKVTTTNAYGQAVVQKVRVCR